MIRVYFIFEDPNDDELVNLSYVDVVTTDMREAMNKSCGGGRIRRALEKYVPR